MSWDRWDSLKRRKGHDIWNKAKCLAREGHTDDQIADALHLPVLNIMPMTAEIRARQKKEQKV